MTPHQYILDALYAAHENGSDMCEVDRHLVVEYAVGCIASDILEPAGGACECGYLDAYYDKTLDDFAPCPYTREDLKPVLLAALEAFMVSLPEWPR